MTYMYNALLDTETPGASVHKGKRKTSQVVTVVLKTKENSPGSKYVSRCRGEWLKYEITCTPVFCPSKLTLKAALPHFQSTSKHFVT